MMEVICLTISEGLCRSMSCFRTLILKWSQVLDPSSQGVFLAVTLRVLVGIQTRPFTLRLFSLATLIRSAHAFSKNLRLQLVRVILIWWIAISGFTGVLPVSLQAITVGRLPTNWFLSENEQRWVRSRSGLHCSGDHVFLKGLGGSVFLRTEAPVSTHSPMINLSLFQTLMIWPQSLFGLTVHWAHRLAFLQQSDKVRVKTMWLSEERGFLADGTASKRPWGRHVFDLFALPLAVLGAQQERRSDREEGQTTEGGQQCRCQRTKSWRALGFIPCDDSHQSMLSRRMIQSDYFVKAYSGCCVKKRLVVTQEWKQWDKILIYSKSLLQ